MLIGFWHKYSPDQPRDDHGRWTGGGSGSGDTQPKPDVLPKVSVPNANGQVPNQANIFVGGADDKGGIVGNHPVLNSDSLNKNTAGNNYYATHDQLDQINAQIAQLPSDQQVNLIGHSWGATTAAQAAVDNAGRINTLVTVDPVGYIHPDYATIGSSVNNWVNVNATGGSFTEGSNFVAGLGNYWGDTANGYANTPIEAPVIHANFDGMMKTPSAGGKTPQQTIGTIQ